MNQEDEGWVEKEEQGVVYTYKGDQWATYETAEQIKEKVGMASHFQYYPSWTETIHNAVQNQADAALCLYKYYLKF